MINASSTMSKTNQKWSTTKENANMNGSAKDVYYDELKKLLHLGENRFCFDCQQRGPTYVNMTIGSFVCMRCSGLLRGLTPPHRVKSISMASFTSDELDFLRVRGNELCKRTWLELYEGQPRVTESADEQQIKQFMVLKYEQKRFTTGDVHNKSATTRYNATKRDGKDMAVIDLPYPPKTNDTLQKWPSNNRDACNNRVNRPEVKSVNFNNNITASDFVADFSKADFFIAPQTNGNDAFQKGGTQNGAFVDTQMESFANFDDNVIFSAAPTEDRYAALKDLDNALKQETHVPNEWNTYTMASSPSSVSSSASFASDNVTMYANPFSTATWDVANPFKTNFHSNGHVDAHMNGHVSNHAFNPFNTGANSAFGGNPFL